MIIYLYVKQHSVTGLKYFGVTKRSNPFQYKGSGKYWLRHLNKHGTNSVKTIDIWGFDNQIECTEFALKFSKDNNIVESSDWANLKQENGKDGNVLGMSLSKDWKDNISKAQRGLKKAPCSEETKRKISVAKAGKSGIPRTKEFKKMQSDRMKENNPAKQDYVKAKISNTLKGRKRGAHSKLTKERMSKSRSTPVEYKGVLYKNLCVLVKETGISKHLYKRYYLNGVDPEPYVGLTNSHSIKNLKPIYLK